MSLSLKCKVARCTFSLNLKWQNYVENDITTVRRKIQQDPVFKKPVLEISLNQFITWLIEIQQSDWSVAVV